MMEYEVFVIYGTRVQYMGRVFGIQRFWGARDGGKVTMLVYEWLWPEEKIVDS